MVRTIQSLKGATYAFVDVETTGTSATYGQVIEIGIVRVEDGVVTHTYSTLVKPDHGINPYITAITGITNDDLEDQPRFEDVAHEVHELLASAIFVAHNARFDYSFIKNEFKRLDMAWNAKTLCTVKLSRLLYPEERHHNLDAVIQRHDISIENRHRAYDDAYALVAFIHAAEKHHGTDAMCSAIKQVLGTHTLPTGLGAKGIDALPHAPGVYFFYDNSDTLLYIGKSIDIKTRVLSHFASDHTSTKERTLTEQVAHVDYETTSGELSALLRESALIKELMPPYNRRLRKTANLAIARRTEASGGFNTIAITYEDSHNISDPECIEGIFKNIRQAKTFMASAAAAHELCPKLLGLEKGSGACFQHQIGRCRGACCGKENPDTYNARLREAFAPLRVRSWPFRGAIVVPEHGEDTADGVAYVVDRWIIRKKISYTPEGYDEDAIDQPFDHDTYLILSKHMLQPHIRARIQPYHPTRDAYAE